MKPRVNPDEHAIERLLSGSTPPEDAAPELAPVASLIASARSAGTEAELGRLGSHVPAMVAVLRGNDATETATGSARAGTGARAHRAVGVVLASVLGLGMVGAAAAATIQQPWRPVSTESTLTSTVDAGPAGTPTEPGEEEPSDSTVPSVAPPAPTAAPADEPASDTPTQVGPAADGPARQGLCTAFGDRTEVPGSSVAATNLRRAAEAAGTSVEQFCSDVATNPAGAGGRPDTAGPPPDGPAADGPAADRQTPRADPPADIPAVTAPPPRPSVPAPVRPDVGGAGAAPRNDASADNRTQGR